MVSIIIPTYNRANIISETLDSVLNQKFTELECIIVDDHSNDDTEIIVQQFVSSDSRFSFYKRPVEMLKGANSCRNFGFEKAKGKYIKFLDSDDLITDDCLEKQVAILKSNQNIKVCFSYGRYFNDSTKKLEEFWSRNKDYNDYLYGHITNQIRWQTADPLWRKSFFNEVPFKEGLMNSQEWLMHGEALLKLKREEIYNLQETLTLIRRGNQRMSSTRTSFYYKNQRKSRTYLLLNLLKMNKVNLVLSYQLIKQIIIFKYWEVRA